MKHALIKRGVYLPTHYKNKTACHYMRSIINGKYPNLKTSEILCVSVPKYSELRPDNVIKELKLDT